MATTVPLPQRTMRHSRRLQGQQLQSGWEPLLLCLAFVIHKLYFMLISPLSSQHNTHLQHICTSIPASPYHQFVLIDTHFLNTHSCHLYTIHLLKHFTSTVTYMYFCLLKVIQQQVLICTCTYIYVFFPTQKAVQTSLL